MAKKITLTELNIDDKINDYLDSIFWSKETSSTLSSVNGKDTIKKDEDRIKKWDSKKQVYVMDFKTGAYNVNKYYYSRSGGTLAFQFSAFTKLQHEAMSNNQLALNYVRLQWLLNEHVDIDTQGRLKIKGSEKFIQRPDICESLGMKNTTSKLFFSMLDDYGIIRQANKKVLDQRKKSGVRTDKVYYINPLIYRDYSGISINAYYLFRDELSPFMYGNDILLLNETIDKLTTVHAAPKKTTPDTINENDFIEQFKDIINSYGYSYNMYSPIEYYDNKDCKTKVSMQVVKTLSHDRDTYYAPNENTNPHSYKISSKDVNLYRMVYADIDSGRDKEGNYLPIEIVTERKKEILEYINSISMDLTIVETRNGYQVSAWITPGSITTKSEWDELEDNFLRLFNGINDASVNNSDRLLRLPWSTWRKPKENLPPFKVSLLRVSTKKYDLTSNTIPKSDACILLKVHADELLEKYPEMANVGKTKDKTGSTRNQDIPTATVEIPRLNNMQPLMLFSSNPDVIAIHKAIASLDPALYRQANNLKTRSLEYLEEEELKSVFMAINISKFLGIAKSDDNRARIDMTCLYHNDSNPSASIYANNNANWRYYCGSPNCNTHDDKGWDIFNIVSYIAFGTPKGHYNEVFSFLCGILSYSVQYKKIA